MLQSFWNSLKNGKSKTKKALFWPIFTNLLGQAFLHPLIYIKNFPPDEKPHEFT